MTNARSNKIEEAAESPNLAELMRECLHSGVIVINGRKEIASFTAAAEALLGVKGSELLNHSVKMLPRSIRQLVEETFASAESIQGRPTQVHRDEQGRITLCVSTVPVVAADGLVSSVVVTLNDPTVIESLEQHIRHFDRLASIGTLSASMAHEIKNALVAVKTFVDLLLNDHKDAELANVVSREMRRIDSIVSQMLRFAGPAKPTFSPLRAHEILDHALRLVQYQLEGKKIALHRSFEAASDWIRGDNYQLEQAFINLFFNALEAMGPKGVLTVATEIISPNSPEHHSSNGAKQPLLGIRIQDTGTGIPPENIQRLFEPFFTTKSKGTGLGLSITRRIIAEHRGTIAVESDLNEGTIFRIAIPLLAKGR